MKVSRSDISQASGNSDHGNKTDSIYRHKRVTCDMNENNAKILLEGAKHERLQMALCDALTLGEMLSFVIFVY